MIIEEKKARLVKRLHALGLPRVLRNRAFSFFFPSPDVELKLFTGMKLTQDVRDAYVVDILREGVYEPMLTKVFIKCIRPNDIVLDVGANVGYFSILSSWLIGAGGKCYSFEPIPTNLRHLRATLASNHIPNVQVVEAFCGNRNDEVVEMSTPSPDNSGTGSVAETGKVRDCRVPTITLDDWCDQQNIQKVNFVKMDIEGGEAYAIVGMLRGLAKRRYEKVAVEFHESHLRSLNVDAAELKQQFVKNGYRAFEIYPPCHLADRTDSGLNGSYMLFMSPGTDLSRESSIDCECDLHALAAAR